MTLEFIRILEIVEVHVRAKFHPAKCSGSWVHTGKRTPTRTILSVATADSKKWTKINVTMTLNRDNNLYVLICHFLKTVTFEQKSQKRNGMYKAIRRFLFCESTRITPIQCQSLWALGDLRLRHEFLDAPLRRSASFFAWSHHDDHVLSWCNGRC